MEKQKLNGEIISNRTDKKVCKKTQPDDAPNYIGRVCEGLLFKHLKHN